MTSCATFSLFPVDLSVSQKHLLYCSDPQKGSSPIDIEVRYRTIKANRSMATHIFNSFFSGVLNTSFFSLSAALITPFVFMGSRASIMGATPKKVCDVAVDHIENLSHFFSYCNQSLKGGAQLIADFIDSCGISCKEMPLFAEGNYLGDKARSFESAIGLILKQTSEIASQCSSSLDTPLYKQRLVNYLGSILKVSQDFWSLSYTPYILISATAGFAFWHFVHHYDEPEKMRRAALDHIKRNMDGMTEELLGLKTNSRTKTQKEELKIFARKIVEQKDDLIDELAALDLPLLDYEAQKQLIEVFMSSAKKLS